MLHPSYNVNPCSGSGNASITLEVINQNTGSNVLFYQFNLSVNEARDTIVDGLQVLQPGIPYEFRMTMNRGKGELDIFRELPPVVIWHDVPGGGLRIKDIKTHDAVSVANDMVRSYEYTEAGSTTSSGHLYGEPKYGYVFNGMYASSGGFPPFEVALLTAQSIVPMGNFEGYQLAYSRVVEKFNGNGEIERYYALDEGASYGNNLPNGWSNPFNYPVAPDLSRVIAPRQRGHFIVSILPGAS